MRVIVLGAGGMLGQDVIRTAPRAFTLTACTRADLDITDETALERRIGEVQPDLIVNAAAYTSVDQAEEDRDLAFRVNGTAVGTLARLAARAGARVVHFSTDYVFSGDATTPYSENAPTRPLSVYGASKLAGEEALQASDARWLLIRTQWLFGVHGRSFPRLMWQRTQQALPTRVVDDQTGKPTFTLDVGRAMWKLVDRVPTGLYHIANGGTATWYELASFIFARAGRSELLTPCRTAEYPTRAPRPSYSVLDTAKAEKVLGTSLPIWSVALDHFLTELGRQGVHA